MKNIILSNRYGDKNHLVYDEEKLAHIEFDENSYGGLRVMLKDGNQDEFEMIDPSGGPYISIGGELDGKIVKEIFWKPNHYYIKFE